MDRRGGSSRPAPASRWRMAGLMTAAVAAWMPGATAKGWPYAAFAWAGEAAVEGLEAAEFRVVLASGESPQGGGELPVVSLGLPIVDGAGRVAFTGRLEDGALGEGFVWLDGAVTWRNSQAPPGVPLVGAAPQLGLGDGGQFLFRAQIEGKDAIWGREGAVARAGVAEPLLRGAVIDLLRRPVLAADGRAYWLAFYKGSQGKGRALFTRSAAGETEVVLRTGDAVTGGVVAVPGGLDLAFDVSSDGTRHGHVVGLEDAAQGVVPAVLLDRQVVLRAGDAAGPEEAWVRFRNLAVSSQGHWVVSGETSARSETDTVFAYDGEIVVREGDRIGEVTLAPQASVVAVDVDDRGRVAHLWSTGGFGRQYVLFSCSADSLAESTVVMRTRPPVYDPGRETITAFENAGHGSALRLGGGDVLYASVQLSRMDGTSRRAVVATRLPACPAPPAAAGEAAVRLSRSSER